MFSQIFNKARGLLPGTAADDSSFTAHASTSEAATDSTIDSTNSDPDMVTATRRGQVGSPQTKGSDVAANGKRKTRATRSDTQSNKRRRTESEDEDDVETHHSSVVVEIPLRRKSAKDDEADEVPETQETNGASNGIEDDEEEEEEATDETQNTTSTDPPKNSNKHIRFGSEEPAPVLNGMKEIPETQPVQPEEEASSDDDDEAPEVVDNSAQLLSLKVKAQKQEEARKRDEILRKEKRKLQDERNKSQAKASKKTKLEKPSDSRPAEPTLAQDDDLISESTATLQGSVVRDSGRLVLPALLPDEILNAEPVYTVPSPAPEPSRQSTKKHKFFDDIKKPAKDIHHGDVTIRVLENQKNMLPPKSSITGRKVKAAWMAGQRNKNGPSGLKRTSGAYKGFVRR
ncbi:hypothetical protein PISL3812_05999 [Talaromyces islandicus]|uniref:Immediate-early protein n=1 Tax=Talaromyces islandicus TaxID=28573 RepID=A0A0U1M078_TALIS|nr:hypothetical protein PISL3812_05999 [Talaromyces islandicus]